MNNAKTTQSRTALHPGRFVRIEIIEHVGLSVKDAATALGVHRVALSRLLNEQAALSAEMAARLEKAFGANMAQLMRMQSEYDIRQAKLKFQGIQVPGNFACHERGRGSAGTAHSRLSKDSRRGLVADAERHKSSGLG